MCAHVFYPRGSRPSPLAATFKVAVEHHYGKPKQKEWQRTEKFLYSSLLYVTIKDFCKYMRMKRSSGNTIRP